MAATPSAGVEALHRLKISEPPMYLTPSPELANVARIASEHLFASLKPYTPKSPFERLLVDEKFDAEQIWQQIDLQSQPLISAIRRQVHKFEKDPQELINIFKTDQSEQEKKREMILDGEKEEEEENFDDDDDDDDEDEDDEEENKDEMEDDRGEDGEREIKERVAGGVEDKFLNIEEMKEFMEDDEAREYGLDRKKQQVKKIAKKYGEDDVDEGEEEEEEEDDDDDDDELGVFGLTGEEDMSDAEDARYEDFFTSNKEGVQNKKPKVSKEVEDIDMSDEEENEDSDIGEEDGDGMVSDDETKTGNLSTHEKQLIKQRAKIEEVERENLATKSWTMQGEVTATKRPKNSALEVDLDWERNAKPPPVITEEVSQSIEELILKRISEGHFDDVQKAPSLTSKAPRETKELDENQSKKGLAEIYADEYAQKTGLISQALSFSDEQKKEASLLFKRLCLKLDALSHFHFTPKPVIEDMSIQTNVPALAMEEIAPLAVSDAAMLAPEEVFSGKGDIKEEAELTQEDRKRRRANKKRKFKAENAKRMATKPRESTQTAGDGKEES